MAAHRTGRVRRPHRRRRSRRRTSGNDVRRHRLGRHLQDAQRTARPGRRCSTQEGGVVLDRRHRHRAVGPERRLGGHRRTEQPPELVVGRRRLQVAGRRHERWMHMGLRDTHHIGRIVMHPTNPDVVYVAALGHLWGPNEERGLYKTDRRRPDLAQGARHQCGHRRRGRGARRRRPHAVRGGLPAAAPCVGIRRRRPARRPVPLARRRRDVGEARRRLAGRRRRPHRRRDLAKPTRTSSTRSTSRRPAAYSAREDRGATLDADEPASTRVPATTARSASTRETPTRCGCSADRSACRSTAARRSTSEATQRADPCRSPRAVDRSRRPRSPGARQRRRALLLVRRQPELGLYRQPADRAVLRHRPR